VNADAFVFLNNDTIPQDGWLAALEEHRASHAKAGVIGSRLLYPDGSTQHAGVAFCEDRFPRHLYAGFPGDHPVVCKSRRVRAVSAACALVRRDAFEQVGGFDEGYENGLEDVDLCLRLIEAGFEVHYCGDSVVQHLEMATRLENHSQIHEGERRYLETWGDRIEPDDIRHYLSDGLMEVSYPPAYPLRMRISPLLAAVDERGREAESDQLLLTRSRQAFDLLRETVRLTVFRSEHGKQGSEVLDGLWQARSGYSLEPPVPREEPGQLRALLSEAHAELRRRDDVLTELVHELQRARYELDSRDGPGNRGPAAAPPGDPYGYADIRRRLRRLVMSVVPSRSTVGIVSRGDEGLMDLGDRRTLHFPCGSGGEYSGVYPASSAEAITQLEDLRERGLRYLVLPATSTWWLTLYSDFGDHLDRHYRQLARDPDTGVVYALVESDREEPARRHESEAA